MHEQAVETAPEASVLKEESRVARLIPRLESGSILVVVVVVVVAVTTTEVLVLAIAVVIVL